MSSFVLNSISPLAPIISSDKGDFSNRCQATKDQIGTRLKNGLAGVGVVGAAAAGIHLVNTNANAEKKLANAFDRILDTFDKKMPQNILKKGADNSKSLVEMTRSTKFGKFLQGLTGKQKAIALIAAPAIIGLEIIKNKCFYNMGQVDQKYTDKAALKEQANKALNLAV